MRAAKLGLARQKGQRQKGNIMLDWLKAILGDAYTEEIDTKVSGEIGKHFVSKADFNAKNDELKTAKDTITERDKQLGELKKSTGDAQTFQQQIADMEQANAEAAKTHAEALKQSKIDAAIDLALTKAGAKNLTATRALLDVEGISLADDGTVTGIDDKLKAIVEGNGYLFDAGAPQMQGMTPASGADGVPSVEQGKYEAQLADARKNNNQVGAIAVKREAAANGIILT